MNEEGSLDDKIQKLVDLGLGPEKVKDLRGQEVRSVHRDDTVVITGAEYLRKTRWAQEQRVVAMVHREEEAPDEPQEGE
jgi:hypothetical protein